MKSLILTTNVSSAGRIKMARIAHRVIPMEQRLVEGPLPSEADDAAFFGDVQIGSGLRDKPDHWQAWIGYSDRRRLGASRPSLVETCLEYDRIEIWVDPEPNGYLVLFQLLRALKSDEGLLDRVSLAFPARCVGELSEAEFDSMRPPIRTLTSSQMELASRAWAAHRHDTPEAWFALLQEDLGGIPQLRSFVVRILAELPSTTNGLGASEARLVELVGSSGAGHETLFGHYLQAEPRPTLDYWEAGRRVVKLSCCEPVIIEGVGEGEFSMALHDDAARFAAYCRRVWSLSALGERVARGMDDLCVVVPVDRWVGNTHLTKGRVWRWDAVGEQLVGPGG